MRRVGTVLILVEVCSILWGSVLLVPVLIEVGLLPGALAGVLQILVLKLGLIVFLIEVRSGVTAAVEVIGAIVDVVAIDVVLIEIIGVDVILIEVVNVNVIPVVVIRVEVVAVVVVYVDVVPAIVVVAIDEGVGVRNVSIVVVDDG